MASFDRVVTDSTNFKGYTGNPPTTEAEQLDEIYHNGVDSWKAVIKVIKDKFPK